MSANQENANLDPAQLLTVISTLRVQQQTIVTALTASIEQLLLAFRSAVIARLRTAVSTLRANGDDAIDIATDNRSPARWYAWYCERVPELEEAFRGADICYDVVTGDFEIGEQLITMVELLTSRTRVDKQLHSRRIGTLNRA